MHVLRMAGVRTRWREPNNAVIRTKLVRPTGWLARWHGCRLASNTSTSRWGCAEFCIHTMVHVFHIYTSICTTMYVSIYILCSSGYIPTEIQLTSRHHRHHRRRHRFSPPLLSHEALEAKGRPPPSRRSSANMDDERDKPPSPPQQKKKEKKRKIVPSPPPLPAPANGLDAAPT